MTPFELFAYLRTNPITPALIPILKANYIDADGHDEIDLQGLESFVFYQQNQLPDEDPQIKQTGGYIQERISYKRIDKEDTSLIFRHSGEGLRLINGYHYTDGSNFWNAEKTRT